MSDAPPAAQRKQSLAEKGVDVLLLVIFVLLCAEVFVYLIGMFAKNATVYSTGKDTFTHVDWINTYMMGKLALSDASHKIYDAKTQLEWYNKVIFPEKITSCCFCQYPPFYAALFSVWTFLPLRLSFIAWNAFSMLLGSIGLFAASRASKALSTAGSLVIIMGALASFPSCDSAMNGELTWLFLFLYCMFYYGLARNRDIIGGIALGLMTLKPHFFLVIFIAALISARKKLLIAGAATVAVLLLLSGCMVGWENVFGYPAVLLHAESSGVTSNLFPERMVCLRGPASVFLPRHATLLVGFLSFIFGIGLTVYVWWRALRKKTLSIEWAMALSLMSLAVTSPHLHVYDCVLLALPAIITLPTVRPTALLGLKPVSLRIWCLLMDSYPIFGWLAMILTPMVGKATAPQWLIDMTSVNGVTCGLLSFYIYLLFHIALSAAGIVYALKPSSSQDASKAAADPVSP